MRRAIIVFFAATLSVRCNVYADPVHDSSAIEAEDAPVESASATHFTTCPEELPSSEAPCSAGSLCEYGTSADLLCNTRLACVAAVQAQSASWTPLASEGACNAAACPASSVFVTQGGPCTLPDVDGGAATDELLCAYARGTCGCTAGPAGAVAHAPTWDCVPPPPAPCPAQRPLIGQACATAGETCDYGSCRFRHGTAMVCDGIAWQATGVPCK